MSISQTQTRFNKNNPSTNLFGSPYWNATSNDTEQQNGKTISIYFSENGIKVKLLQLEVNQILGFKIAQLSGEPIIQYSDLQNIPHIDVQQTLRAIKSQLKKHNVKLLVVRNVRQDCKLYKLLEIAGNEILAKKSPFIDLTGMQNMDDYFKTLSASSRKSRRRTIKKLETTFVTDFEIITNKDITSNLVDKVIELKKRQLDSINQTSRLFADEKQLAKLKHIILNKNKDFECIISTLKLDGQIVAAEIGYLHLNKYYSFIGAMDNQFSQYSPGAYQLIKTIEWAIQNDVEVFDLLPPEDDYKFKWSSGKHTNVYDFILPLNSSGKHLGLFYFKTARPYLKKIFLKLRPQISKISLAYFK